jgi:hypothetical protein
MYTTTARRRAISLAAVGLVALVSAFVALGLSAGDPARADSTVGESEARISADELAFRNDMRKLWEDHVTWTRMVIVSFAAELPDLNPAIDRLLANQSDIGDAVKPFYGDAAGDRLTALLRDHILIAADVLAAAKAGDADALAHAQERWRTNADDIAAFLTAANPRNWPLPEMKSMMRDHLELTTEEAVGRLSGDWASDIAAYDKVHRQALEMADMLSTGIIRQFPQRFRR